MNALRSVLFLFLLVLIWIATPLTLAVAFGWGFGLLWWACLVAGALVYLDRRDAWR